MPSEPAPRHRMRFQFAPETLARMLTTGQGHTVTLGLPPGAQVISWHTTAEFAGDVLECIVEHPSFPPTEPGVHLPVAQPVEVTTSVNPAAVSGAAWDFTLQGSDGEPVYMVTLDGGACTERQVHEIRRSLDSASVNGRFVIVPSSVHISRIE